MGTRIAQLV